MRALWSAHVPFDSIAHLTPGNHRPVSLLGGITVFVPNSMIAAALLGGERAGAKQRFQMRDGRGLGGVVRQIPQFAGVDRVVV